MVVDPTLAEQVVAGQLVRADGKAFYEVWCRFQARSIRDGRREAVKAVAELQDYRIEARLGTDLHMQVKVAATLVPHRSGARAIGFDISDKLEMTAVRIDGEEVEVLQSRQPPKVTRNGSDGTLVVAVLPEPTRFGETRHMEFEYRGKVVSDAGSGVYSVSDRTSWYPRIGNELTTYELSFRYPGRLESWPLDPESKTPLTQGCVYPASTAASRSVWPDSTLATMRPRVAMWMVFASRSGPRRRWSRGCCRRLCGF